MGNLKKYWIQFTILIGLFIGMVLTEYYAPKPQDWTPSFAKDDKIPYGNYVLFHMLEDLFPEQEIEVNDYSFYESPELFDGHSNVILIAKDFNKMDSIDNSIMLDHVSRGGNIFMAAEYFKYSLLDTLNLSLSSSFFNFIDSTQHTINFHNPKLASDSGYIFPKNIHTRHFEKVDSSRTIALGTVSDSLNFIRIKLGRGSFFLHSQPVLFTNYNILYENNAEYIERALSYLPKRNVIWDEYHHHYSKKKKTPLRYIFSQRALHSAWITLLIGVILYIIFEGKRVQRIIPIITPPRNHSLDFITTIGRLYFHRRDNKDLAEKKFIYLTEYLRNKQHINIQDTKLENAKGLAQRLDVNSTLIEKLFALYNIIKSKKQISNQELFDFHNLIEDFYQQLKN